MKPKPPSTSTTTNKPIIKHLRHIKLDDNKQNGDCERPKKDFFSDDVALLMKSIDTSINSVAEILKIIKNATPEIIDLLSKECSLIFECKICKNLFRSIANFMTHKRGFCIGKFEQLFQDHQHADHMWYSKCRHNKTYSSRSTTRKDIIALVETMKAMTTEHTVSEQILMQDVSATNEALFNLRFQSEDPKMENERITTITPLEVETNDNRQTTGELESFDSSRCTFCQKEFFTQKALNVHMKKNHGEMKLCFVCPCCKKYFANSWSVYRHMYKVHKKTSEQVRRLRSQIQKKRVSEVELYRSKKGNLTTPQDGKTQDKAFMLDLKGHGSLQQCPECGKHFERKAALFSHKSQCKMKMAASSNLLRSLKRKALAPMKAVEEKKAKYDDEDDDDGDNEGDNEDEDEDDGDGVTDDNRDDSPINEESYRIKQARVILEDTISPGKYKGEKEKSQKNEEAITSLVKQYRNNFEVHQGTFEVLLNKIHNQVLVKEGSEDEDLYASDREIIPTPKYGINQSISGMELRSKNSESPVSDNFSEDMDIRLQDQDSFTIDRISLLKHKEDQCQTITIGDDSENDINEIENVQTSEESGSEDGSVEEEASEVENDSIGEEGNENGLDEENSEVVGFNESIKDKDIENKTEKDIDGMNITKDVEQVIGIFKTINSVEVSGSRKNVEEDEESKGANKVLITEKINEASASNDSSLNKGTKVIEEVGIINENSTGVEEVPTVKDINKGITEVIIENDISKHVEEVVMITDRNKEVGGLVDVREEIIVTQPNIIDNSIIVISSESESSSDEDNDNITVMDENSLDRTASNMDENIFNNDVKNISEDNSGDAERGIETYNQPIDMETILFEQKGNNYQIKQSDKGQNSNFIFDSDDDVESDGFRGFSDIDESDIQAAMSRIITNRGLPINYGDNKDLIFEFACFMPDNSSESSELNKDCTFDFGKLIKNNKGKTDGTNIMKRCDEEKGSSNYGISRDISFNDCEEVKSNLSNCSNNSFTKVSSIASDNDSNSTHNKYLMNGDISSPATPSPHNFDVDDDRDWVAKKINSFMNSQKKKCLLCFKTFHKINFVRRHVALHFNINKFKCLVNSCNFQSYFRNETNNHLMKVHKKKEIENLIGRIYPKKEDFDYAFYNPDPKPVYSSSYPKPTTSNDNCEDFCDLHISENDEDSNHITIFTEEEILPALDLSEELEIPVMEESTQEILK